MGEEEKNPNPMYLPADLVEEILLRLPLKPILKFKSVSKQWRSTLESKSFAERRRKTVQKNPTILAIGESRFQGDSEIDVFYLQHAETIRRPSLTCDGLVCITVLRWVYVLNPSTGEFLRFPSLPSLDGIELYIDVIFPDPWAMGFGRDEVKGSYKVVRMLFHFNIFEILDVHIGEWRKLSPPPFRIEAARKSACVNGSIYWLDLKHRYQILALDLHTEEFRHLPLLISDSSFRPRASAQIVNLEDRLTMAYTCTISHELKLEIWSMDAQEETWTRTYYISLSRRVIYPTYRGRWFTPVAVSKQGNLFLYDSDKRLFKYHPDIDYLICLSRDICVITPFLENLVPLRLQAECVQKITTSGYGYGLRYLQPRFVPKISASSELLMTPTVLLTSALIMSLLFFGYRYKFCS